MEAFPNIYSSEKDGETVCANYSLFHIGNGATPPQAVVQKVLQPPNA